ncbi:hypothetical protein RAHE111665_07645 [Rariglobus hedericola]
MRPERAKIQTTLTAGEKSAYMSVRLSRLPKDYFPLEVFA